MATAAYYGTSISEHLSRTPEGFLIAHDAVLCRTAERVPMIYLRAEVGAGTDDVVRVYRSAKELFSPKHVASLEGKPICDTHPARFVDVQNASLSAKGHVQNVRKGDVLPNGEGCLIGDIVVTDATLAE